MSDLVSPTVRLDDLPSFFWNQFELDVRLLARNIGRSVEDAVVVGHRMLNSLLTNSCSVPGGFMQISVNWHCFTQGVFCCSKFEPEL